MPSAIPVYRGSASYPEPARGPVVTIGNFDGVHQGHRALIDRALALAAEHRTRVCAYTFDPAPVDVLRPEARKPRIQTLDDRVMRLAEAGVDEVVVERFDRAYAEHEPEWFAREVLLGRLGAVAVVVGWDFRFGRGRAGDASVLARLMPVPVVQVAQVALEGQPVSSSRVRKRVLAGEVEDAARLLGRPHRVVGEVVVGDGRGRTLGFPTANLRPLTELLPAPGVYAVRVDRDGALMPGVANLGARPTFGGEGVRFEVHLLDFSGDLYGERLAVELVGRIRGEQRFPSAEALATRIRADADEARRLLGAS